jgi:hypothetical protein
MNFLDLAAHVIGSVNQPLTINEIWDKAVEMQLTEALGSG